MTGITNGIGPWKSSIFRALVQFTLIVFLITILTLYFTRVFLFSVTTYFNFTTIWREIMYFLLNYTYVTYVST